MQQEFRSQARPSGRETPARMTALGLRTLGQLYEMNLSLARVMLRTQARAASAIGLPDWSGWFDAADERARQVFTDGADQLVNTAQKATEAASQLQREVGRVVETQAVSVAQTVQQGLEEIATQTNEGLNQLVETTRQQADEAERLSASLAEEVRTTLREGGQQARDSIREGADRLRGTMREAGEQAREAVQEGGEQEGAALRSAEDKGKRKSA
jgi:hypothetical protein